MSITLTKITPHQHLSAVQWVMDAFPAQEGEARHLTAQQSYRVVERQYEGGWVQFIADLQPVAPCTWCGTPTGRWDSGTPDCGC